MKLRKFPITLQATIFVLFVCIALIVIDAWQTWNAYNLRMLETRATTRNLANGLAQQAEDTLKIADTVVVGIVERLQQEGRAPANIERLHKFMMTRVAELPLLQRVTAIDAQGNWIITSQQSFTQAVNNSDREYFIFHRNHTSLEPHIGPPIRARSNGAWIITVSRRVNNPDGSFAGVALVSIDMAYFDAFYRSFDLGKLGAISLLSDNAILLARRPFDEKLIGKDISSAPLFRSLLPKNQSDTFVAKSSIDGVVRLFSYQHLQDYPLIVVAALSQEETFADWRANSYRNFIVLTILEILIAVIGFRFIKQINLRLDREAKLIIAQAELKALNAELEKLSQQDGLTGLTNRRQFDILLAEEFSRATRYQHALSILMIDVDLFKQFNDTYGHPAGDECLRAVGRVLKSNINRPGDVAARYGGEEFIVLLHDADSEGAAIVAEKIRLAIYDLKIQHFCSPFAAVTISCGVHTIVPLQDSADTPASLIEAADSALYVAKSSGRNRISVSDQV